MKIREFLKKNIFGIIGGIMILGTSIVLADNLQASTIHFNKQNSIQHGATKDYVQDVIDELYTKGQAKLATVQAQASATTIYSMPRLVYLDPTNLTKVCRQSDLVDSTQNIKVGCMKWYIYGETGDGYIAILDHNTTAKVAYNSGGDKTTPKEVATALTNDTSSWDSSLNARLITADEVAEITGANTKISWNSASSTNWFYLDSLSTTQEAKSQGASSYAWLFDYTTSCTSYGCNTVDNNTNGYWTSTAYKGSDSYVWNVVYNGYLSYSSANYTNYGVRPVIEFSKSILLNRS